MRDDKQAEDITMFFESLDSQNKLEKLLKKGDWHLTALLKELED